MTEELQKIKKIEKIFKEFNEIPYECFSDIYNCYEITSEILEKIRNVIKGGDQ